MELKNISNIENATHYGRAEMFRFGVGLTFIILIMLVTGMSVGHMDQGYMLIAAAMIGGYMAMNIGANDVANNVGPAVGSKALTMFGAIAIAAVFEAGGALIAGGDVVDTIKKGIIDPSMAQDPQVFIWLMMAALLAGALWLNLATALGAPVSTTHSIVGGVLGAGIAAGGMDIANWGKVGQIALSWLISPLMGGVIAAAFLYFIKRTITYQKDMKVAAKKMVPLLVAVMSWAFATYLVMKGLKKLWKVDFFDAAMLGLLVAVLIYVIVGPWIRRAADRLPSEKSSVNKLFTLPLIFAAALLSFAHGANDVANAVGPLAAINDAILHGGVSAKAGISFWVMLVGAIGISIGLALYGPKLIRTVGSEITELDQVRAFSIAMAASLTVIIATQLGLPVSSTHIAVGAVFGVGFLREYLKASYSEMVEQIKLHHLGRNEQEVEALLLEFRKASIDEKGLILRRLKERSSSAELSKKERKDLKRVYKTELVKRSAVMKIIAAWLITLPVSGFLAAFIFFAIRGMMLP